MEYNSMTPNVVHKVILKESSDKKFLTFKLSSNNEDTQRTYKMEYALS